MLFRSQIILMEGSRRWLKSPPMLSLYTLLLRIGLSHESGNNYTDTIERIKNGSLKPYQKQDTSYLNNCDIALSKILRYGDRKIFDRNIKKNYPLIDVKDMHNRLGVVGYSIDCVRNSLGFPVSVPSWHQFKD